MHYGVSAYTFQALVVTNTPPIFMNTLWYLNKEQGVNNQRDLSVIDMFAGVGWIYSQRLINSDQPPMSSFHNFP